MCYKTDYLEYRYIRTKNSKETEKENLDFDKNKEDVEKNKFEKSFKVMENEIKRRMEEYAKQQNVDPKLVNAYTKKMDVKKSKFY